MAPAIEKYVMARTMNQLRASMPDAPPAPTFQTHQLDFDTEEEAEFYRGMSGVIQKRWKALGSESALEKLQLFMRLRQLSLHPQIYIDARKKALHGQYNREDWDGSSTKFNEICKMVEKGGVHKWIVFCHFHKEMEMLKEMLKPICKVQVYNGSLNAKEKEAVLAESAVGTETEVLLVQLQSGGTGLNLQHFDRIIFSGPWWTSALMDQAIGRAVRIGQTEIVRVYFLKLKEEEALNIDTYMFEKAAEKGELCRQVLETANTQAV
jgi:SNF2 family DNA or RNA helicase